MNAHPGTCPDCGGPAVFRAGLGACMAAECWWAGEVLPVIDQPGETEPIEDISLGARRVRVERVGPGDYLWSVYVDADELAGLRRGRAPSREEAWRAALSRVESADG